MGTPFLASINVYSFNFAPKGWAMCNGQLLAINSNQALFSLLGTTFGGDGRVNFALPNLRGCAAVGMGAGITLGEAGGQESHTITFAEMPAHTHQWSDSTGAGTTGSPTGNILGQAAAYTAAAALTTMSAQAISQVGGSQPHTNQSPYLVLNFCIALQGIFPSQT